MRPATLDGIRGTGIVTVLRDADGAIVKTNGTFRPTDPDGALEALRSAAADGRRLPFQGEILDAADAAAGGSARVEVAVTGVASYRDLEGGERTYINFVRLDA